MNDDIWSTNRYKLFVCRKSPNYVNSLIWPFLHPPGEIFIFHKNDYFKNNIFALQTDSNDTLNDWWKKLRFCTLLGEGKLFLNFFIPTYSLILNPLSTDPLIISKLFYQCTVQGYSFY